MIRFLLVTSLLLVSLLAQAADLETILAETAKAHGGDALAQVDGVRHRLSIKEPTYEVEGIYTATRAGRMRIDIYAGGERAYAEGLMEGPDGACAWEWTRGKPASKLSQCVGEKETAALRHGIEMPGHFFTIQDVRERGATVELITGVEWESSPEWQVRVRLPDGFARDYFIDKTTYRLTRSRDYRAFHPGIDPTEVTVETRYFEPEFVDGVLRYKRIENVNADTGERLGTTKVLSVEHNPEIAEGYFSPAFVPEKR